MAFEITLENFQGPFDVLLDLLSKKKLDITELSLGSITNDYLSYIENTDLLIEELNWFLIIAAKLALDKSAAILLTDSEDDEISIEQSLKEYSRVKELSEAVGRMMKRPLLTSVRVMSFYAPLEKIELITVRENFEALMSETRNRAKQRVIKSQSNKIDEIRKGFLKKLRSAGGLSQKDIISSSADRVEAIVGLMTILELIKNGELSKNNDRYEFIGVGL